MSGLLGAIAGRLALAATTLLVVAAIVFFLMRAIPGDPVLIWLGTSYDPETYARLKALYGLDRSLGEQFLIWLGNLLQGDLGKSVLTQLPVSTELLRRVPVTVELILMALIIAILLGGGAGIWAARHAGKPSDHALLAATLFGISIPEFFMGAVLMLAFALWLGVLPPTGFAPVETPVAHLSHLILPALALGVPRAAVICRMVRGSLLEVFGKPFVRAARAKGLTIRAVLFGHALRNALIPVITVLGLQVGYLVGGAVVVEKLFVIPGLGAYGLNAVLSRDYPSVQGFVLVVAAIFLLANLLVDIAYLLLDPRIRDARARSQPA